MKRKLKIIIAAVLIAAAGVTTYSLTATAHDCATCNGTGTCTACKNCKYCKHCSKDKGTCSVCR